MEITAPGISLMPDMRQLKLFFSYASQDVAQVSALYHRLTAEPWLSIWFDKEALLPGMDWDLEIYKGLRQADLILVFLSKESVAKEGYVQKEFKRAVSYAEEKPDGTIFVIPVRLDDCPLPLKFQQWQWLNLFEPEAEAKLLKSLKIRTQGLGIESESKTLNAKPAAPVSVSSPSVPNPVDRSQPESDLDLHSFVKINALGQKPFWIGKYPVTNAQYARFLQADDFANPQFWLGFPKFDENCQPAGNWGEAGLNWLREKLKDYEFFPPEMWKVEPEFWQDPDFGIAQPKNPVVGVNFYEASAYSNWLLAHWSELPEAQVNSIQPKILRLPCETEWVAAAGGDKPEGRYPWDLPGRVTTDANEIFKRANVAEKIEHTTPVNQYPSGKSPHGVLDLAGNVWEWQVSFYEQQGFPARRGGSWGSDEGLARVFSLNYCRPNDRYVDLGFRMVAIPS